MNWKTTLAGALGSLGATMLLHASAKWEWWLGAFLFGAFPAAMGSVAKDHDKTGPDNDKIL